MRALAVFPEKRNVRIIDVPEPALGGPREVAVKIREVGICGTDREICGFHYGTPPRGADRLVLGHEAIGEVLDIGPQVRSLSRGDLVAMTVRRPCDDPQCRPCRAGRQDLCTTGGFRERGIKEADGFMTERVVEDERHLVKLPRALADVAVLVEPLTIAGKAAMQLQAMMGGRYSWEPPDEPRGLVLGAGPVGLLGAMMLLSRHVATFVYSLEPADSDRARLVRAMGGHYLSGRDVPLGELRRKIGPVDLVYEAVGNAAVAFGAVPVLAPNGVCIFTGVPAPGSTVSMDLGAVMRGIVLGNQVLFGTVNAARSTFEEAVGELKMFMVEFPQAVRELISERVALEDAPALLRQVPQGIKQVVVLAEPS